jgi:hypothetical protein
MPAPPPGVGKVSDLDTETREYLGLIAILASGLTGGDSRGTWQPQQPDPGQFRYVQQGGRLLAIPPARRP